MTSFLLESPKCLPIAGDETAVAEATRLCESLTGIAIMPQKWQHVLDAWPIDLMVRLHRRPLIEVMVRAFMPSRRAQENGHWVNRSMSRPIVPRHIDPEQGEIWLPALDLHLRPFGGIEITYTAGCASRPEDVPDELRAALQARVALIETYRRAG